MAIYLEYEGVKGNIATDGYQNHIAVDSVSFGVDRGISMEPGKLSDREATRPRVSEIKITKVTDNSITAIFKEAVTGSAGKKVVIKFVRIDAGEVQEYMDYTLENCLVSGYAIAASSDGEPQETVTLSFSKITINYNDFDATNKLSSHQCAGYDLSSITPL